MEIWPEELPPPYEVLLEKAGDAEGLLTTLNDKIDTTLMDAAPKLKVVSNFAVGYDNISVAEVTKRHIVVSNTPEVLTGTTADPLLTLDNIIITPHIASASFTTPKTWLLRLLRTFSLGYAARHHQTVLIPRHSEIRLLQSDSPHRN